jgi:hypothetical protein
VATIMEIRAAITDQIDAVLTPLVEGLQTSGGRMLTNPSPPSIDIYPASPFQEQIAMGRGNNEMFFNVRARVNTPDHEGAEELLCSLMDPTAATSVALAITSDLTLGGLVEDVWAGPPTDYQLFVDTGGGGGFLGCLWLTQVTP